MSKMAAAATPTGSRPPSRAATAASRNSEESEGPSWVVEVGQAEVLPSNRTIAEDKDEIIARVKAAYDAGTPFFTKDAIRSVVEAFDRIRLEGSNETVSITGIDGVPIEFRLRTGEPLSWYKTDPNYEVIM